MSLDITPATAQLPPPNATSRPPPYGHQQPTRWLIAAALLGLLVATVVATSTGDLLRRSTETTTAVDGDIRAVVVEKTDGDVHVSPTDDAARVTVSEHRPPFARATNTSTFEDGVLRLTSTCSSWLARCSVDHHVELPAGADVQVRATAGEVRLTGVGDVDVEIVAGNVIIDDATGASFITRTETGGTEIETASTPELVDARATTGGVAIAVPDAAYRVDAAAVIGSLDVSIDHDADASSVLRAHTVTGEVSVRPATSPSVTTGAAEQADTPADPSGFDSPAALETFLDDVMAEHVDRFPLAGASVTVVKDGEVWVSKGYGHADIATGTPVEADATLFPTASVAKLFTWTAVMQLVERGQLDLDAEVNSYLSGFSIPDDFAEPVRVRHLLSHTAGFEDKPMSLLTRPEDLTDLQSALLRDMPAQGWEPGRSTAYSNYSAALAGHLVAEVSGMTWENYLTRNILDPLGMSRTSPLQPTPESTQPGMTKVYSSGDGEHLEAPHDIVALAPVGGMVATTDDMGRFMLAHLQQGRLGDARILQEATARQMHSQLFTHDPRLAGNAHGFWESTEHGQRILSHGGDHNTSSTWLALLPDHDLGIYVAYNSDRGAEARSALWEAFLDHGFGEEARTAPDPAAGPPANLERFAGTYGSNRISSTTPAKLIALSGVMTVAAEDGRLITDLPGYEAQRWLPAGDDEFAAADGSARMIFRKDAGRPLQVFFDGPVLTPYSPLSAWVATPWYDRAGLHGGLLAASLLLIVSALVLWPALAVVRRRSIKTDRDSTARTGRDSTAGARWWAAVTGGLYLLFAGLVVVSLLDYMALEYGAPPLLRTALTVGIAAALLTLGAVVHTILAWRNGHWSMAGRVHYTLVTLAFVTLAWQLNHWQLLGFHV